MLTGRYELKWFDVWWYAKIAKCRAGNATCIKRTMSDDMNGPLWVLIWYLESSGCEARWAWELYGR
jgi:hypothetical protein